MIPDLDPPISADQQEILEGLPGQGAVTLTRLWGNYLATGEARPAKLTENLSSAGLSLGDWYAFADAGKVIETEYIKPGTWDGKTRDLMVMKHRKGSSGNAQHPYKSWCKTTPFSEMEDKELEYLWEDWLPLGLITLLEGSPKTGKSHIAYDLMARLSRGDSMPYEVNPCPPSDSILINPEDPAVKVVRQRLRAAGADLKRVHLLDGIHQVEANGKTSERRFTLTDANMEDLERLIGEKNARLVYIDAVMGILSGKNPNAEADVRSVLEPLNKMCDRLNCAVLLARHTVKLSATRAARERGIGSVAWSAVGKSQLLVGKHPDDPNKRVVALTMSGNGEDGVGRCFSLETTPLEIRGKISERYARVEWREQIDNFDSNQMDRFDDGKVEGKRETASEKAEVWLKRFLAQHGEASDKAIKEAAKVDGVGKNALWEAKGAMKGAGAIRSARRGGELWWIGTAPEGKTFEDVFGE